MRHWLPCLAVATGLLGLHLTPALAAETATTVVLSGTITETTDPAKPTTADLLVTLTAGKGVVRIGAPLYGSGGCMVESLRDGQLVLKSEGPMLRIIWTGTTDGESFSGTYEAQNLMQPSQPARGTFALKFGTGEPLAFTDVIGGGRYTHEGKDYMVLVERDVLSLHQTTGEYMGLRIMMNEKQEPTVIIQDYADGSRYLHPTNSAVLAEWTANGSDGYFSMPQGNVTHFFDRFLTRLPWTKVTPKEGAPFFVRAEGEQLELFDKDLKSLNIRSGKTDTGRMYWTQTEGNITSFFDEQLRPLHWHAVQTERGLLYATPHPKKAGQWRFFDANMRELKKPSFWRKLAYGVAVGMMAYGQALQQSAQTAQAAAPTYTYGTAGTTTTTANTIGQTTFYNSYGPGGPSSMTSQRIGNTEFLHGYSPAGGTVSGMVNHIGPTAFIHLNSAAGSWNGSTQRVGNFAFHNLYGPRGQSLHGSSHRVGNWIFTTMR